MTSYLFYFTMYVDNINTSEYTILFDNVKQHVMYACKWLKAIF